MKKRWVSLLLLIIMISAAVPAFNIYASSDLYYRLNQTFENLETTDNFVSDIKDLQASFLSSESEIKVVGSDFSLLGKRSLAVKKCDMRWWNVGLSDEKMYVELSIRADAEFNNELIVHFSTKQPTQETSLVSNVIAFAVSKKDGKPAIVDCNGNVVTQMQEDIRYAVKCEFTRGSDKYNIYINNVLTAENCINTIKVYSVEDFNINVNSLNQGDKESYILIDNPSVSAKGKLFPQAFSSQPTAKIPEIEINETPKTDDLRIFVNTTEIAMANPPVLKKNTVYVDLEQMARCLGMMLKDDKANNSFVFSNGNVTVEGTLGSKKIKVNGSEITVAYPPEKINKTIMVTPNFFTEALNAKVWWDNNSGLLVITTGQFKKDNILKSIGGKLYMNGEPYYEISFNKFDLFYQILAAYESNIEYPSEENTVPAAEAALKQLHELGFKSIRVFAYSNVYSDLMYNEVHQETYFKAMDQLFDLCDKYDIKIVMCMGLAESFLLKNDKIEEQGFITSTETAVDIVANPNCESRQNVYKYIEKFVNRYKERNALLMWEICNEGNLNADVGATTNKQMYSLVQLAEFYGSCADKIREYDNKHLITSGDSILRNSQWNLLTDVLKGNELSWQTDTREEQLKALALLNNKLDVISIHAYGLGISDKTASFDIYMQYADKLDKPLYVGETNGAFSLESEDFYLDSKAYLNSIINSGVQLSHWWTFRSDRQGFEDGYLWRIDSGELLDLIVEANKSLKEKYHINKADDENTTDAWQDPYFQVLDISKVTDGKEFAVMASLNSKLIRFGILSCVMFIVVVICVVLLTREKLKRKRTEDFV